MKSRFADSLCFPLTRARIRNVKISAVLIAFNEEKNIARAINSLKLFADEILLIDSESTDRTREIAENLGAKVIVQSWLGFARQKQFAVDTAAHEYIFSLDADEEVSLQLQTEISLLKNSEKKLFYGYKIPRLSFYMNRPIRHAGWYPDWQLRLFNRTKGKWKDVLIHESFEMKEDTKIGKLKGDIFHYSVETAAEHHRMIGERYAPLAAQEMFERGKRVSKLKVASAGMLAFIRSYFLQLGFLDGFAGFCIARFAAHHAFLKNLLLYQKLQAEDQSADTEDLS